MCMALCAVAVALLTACADDDAPQYKDAKSTPMTFVVDHPSMVRATDSNFETGDRIGLYVSAAGAPPGDRRQPRQQRSLDIRRKPVESRPHALLGRRHIQCLCLLSLYQGCKQR